MQQRRNVPRERKAARRGNSRRAGLIVTFGIAAVVACIVIWVVLPSFPATDPVSLDGTPPRDITSAVAEAPSASGNRVSSSLEVEAPSEASEVETVPTETEPTPTEIDESELTDTGMVRDIPVTVYDTMPMKDEATSATSGSRQATSTSSAATTATTSAQNSATDRTPTTTTQDLAARDADFAVDPNRTQWTGAATDKKVIYLTIDDGPSELTPQVLDVLDRYGVKATFFVTGHSPEHYHLIKEAYDRGHTIGLHTYSHDYATVYASDTAYYNDLDAIGQVVKEQIGYVPCFIRFPGGSSNAVSADYSKGIMTRLTSSVRDRGYQYFDWNVSTGDGADHTADEIAGYGSDDGGLTTVMLLCHDSATKQTTVDALPRIIESYLAKGYTFKAIDRNAPAIQHGVNN